MDFTQREIDAERAGRGRKLPQRTPDWIQVLLDEAAKTEFKPHVYYDKGGDCMEVLASDGAYFGKRIDDHLTLYVSEETGELVGVVIENVSRLMKANGVNDA